MSGERSRTSASRVVDARERGEGILSSPAVLTVVVVTRDRREDLSRALDALAALPEQPPVVVVDNGSVDGTARAVARSHSQVRVIRCVRDRGPAARNLGVAASGTPLVAFNDDDSAWEPGALGHAVRAFADHPRLALLAARVVVGADGRLDPACRAMESSPLGRSPDLPGPSVLGFLACGAVVHRRRFLECGGFPRGFGFGGEEAPLALALADAGWGLAYVPEVVTRHHPSPTRDPVARRRAEVRNNLLLPWMRLPIADALADTARAVHGPDRRRVLRALPEVAGRVLWNRADRSPVRREVVAQWRRLAGADQDL